MDTEEPPQGLETAPDVPKESAQAKSQDVVVSGHGSGSPRASGSPEKSSSPVAEIESPPLKSPRDPIKSPRTVPAPLAPMVTEPVVVEEPLAAQKKDSKGYDDASQRNLGQTYVSAAQTTKHHLSICLKLLGIMYEHYEERAEKERAEKIRSGEKETAAPLDGSARSEDKQYLAVVMLNSALLKAMHVAESFQAHCCRHYPELSICQQDDLISFDGTLTTIYEDEDAATKKNRKDIPKEKSVSAEEHRRVQAQYLVAKENLQNLEKQHEGDASDIERLKRKVTELQEKLREKEKAELRAGLPPDPRKRGEANPSPSPDSKKAAEANASKSTSATSGGSERITGPLESLGVTAERHNDSGVVSISEGELQRLVLIMQNLTRAVEEARASETEARAAETKAKCTAEDSEDRLQKLQTERQDLQRALRDINNGDAGDLVQSLQKLQADKQRLEREVLTVGGAAVPRPAGANRPTQGKEVSHKEFHELQTRYHALQQKHQMVEVAYGRLKKQVLRDRQGLGQAPVTVENERYSFEAIGRSKPQLQNGSAEVAGGKHFRGGHGLLKPTMRGLESSEDEGPSDGDSASVIRCGDVTDEEANSSMDCGGISDHGPQSFQNHATDEEGSSIEVSDRGDRGERDEVAFAHYGHGDQDYGHRQAWPHGAVSQPADQGGPLRCPSAPDLRGENNFNPQRQRRRRVQDGSRTVPISTTVAPSVTSTTLPYERRKVPFVVCSNSKSHHSVTRPRLRGEREKARNPPTEYGAWLEGRQFAKAALRYAKNPGDTLALRELMGLISAENSERRQDNAAEKGCGSLVTDSHRDDTAFRSRSPIDSHDRSRQKVSDTRSAPSSGPRSSGPRGAGPPRSNPTMNAFDRNFEAYQAQVRADQDARNMDRWPAVVVGPPDLNTNPFTAPSRSQGLSGSAMAGVAALVSQAPAASWHLHSS